MVDPDQAIARWLAAAEAGRATTPVSTSDAAALARQLDDLRAERGKLEAELTQFAALYEFAPVGYFSLDRRGRVQRVNSAAAALLGAEPAALIGQALASFVEPGLRPQFAALVEAACAGGVRDSLELSLLGGRPSSPFRFVQIDVAPGSDSDHCLAALIDISERRRFESALRGSESFGRAILDSIAQHVAVLDGAGVIRAVNAAWLRFAVDNAPATGVAVRGAEVGGNYLAACVASEGGDRELAEAARAGIVAVLDGSLPTFTLEYPCHSPDRQRWFVMTVTPLGNAAGVVVTHTNISERKLAELAAAAALSEARESRQALLGRLDELKALNLRLEHAHNQLLQSEKMAAIGQLAAGVAHELNNPIGFIQSNFGSLETYIDDLLEVLNACEACANACPVVATQAQFRQLREAKDVEFIKGDIRQLLAESKEGADRVRRIVQNLKEFSHVSEDEWSWADLHRGLDSTLTIVRNEIKYKAEVEKRYGELPPVFCMPSQINQVFMNLLVNAAQAIDGRGRIVIASGRDGDRVWIEVSDSGKGIPAEHLDRIFEPFFTTKPVGKGTGLGLSLAYGIIARHHGKLSVSSKPGAGSTFRIDLPIETAPPENCDR